MRKTLLTGLCIMLVLASGASAHKVGPTTLGGVAPSAVGVPGGVFGVAFCQNLPTGGGSLPFFCGTNGLGVFFDVTGIDCDGASGCGAADAHSHANGNCQVIQGGTRLHGNDYFFLCGTDRNDDGFVTDNPACVAEDDLDGHGAVGVTNHEECTGERHAIDSSVGEDHADDWVFGDHITTSVPFCFQDDVLRFTADPSDDTGQRGDDVNALNQADGSWDDFMVFVGIPLPASPMDGHIGDAIVTLDATGGSACSGVPYGWVSAHGTGGNPRAGGRSSSCLGTTYCLEFLSILQ